MYRWARRRSDYCIERRRNGALRVDDRERQTRDVRIVAGELRRFLVLIAQPVEHAVAAADHKLLRLLVSEAETRTEIVVIAVDDRAREAAFAGQLEAAGFEIEQRTAVARVHRLRIEFVAHAEIERQLARGFPVVLELETGVDPAVAAPVQHLGAFVKGREPQQHIGERRAGAVAVRARRVGGTEDDVAVERQALQNVVLVAAEIGAHLERVVAARDVEIVRHLKRVLDVVV